MKRYRYKAKDAQGKVVSGEVEAANEVTAAKLVRQRDLILLELKGKRETNINFLKFFKDRITSGDIVNFTRQLATMVNAGLPLTEALLILRTQSKGSMQKIVSQILSEVEEGQSLSSAMSKHKKAFSKTYIALIKSGEVGGVLDDVLVRLADNLEKQQEFKGRIKGAMIYPVIIVIAMVAVAFIMMVFVVPKLTELYENFDAELPFATRFLITVSKIMSRYWIFIIMGFVGMAYAFRLYRKTDKGRHNTDSLILRLPLIGDMQKQIVLTDLTRTLSLMVGSGVSILEGLQISADVVGNSIIADALADVSHLVEKGFPIAYSFSRHSDAFPFILSQMVAVGEETGKMDEVMGKLSHVFETESDQKLKAITAAVEPAILIILGLGVAFLVISIIMPIYNLTTAL